MRKQRSESEQQIADLMQTAKRSLRLSVAFLSRMDGTTQHLEVVESSIPVLFHDGIQQKKETTVCQHVLDGRLPAVMPDMRRSALAMSLPVAKMPRIRSYVTTPVVLSDGTLCAFGFTSDAELTERTSP